MEPMDDVLVEPSWLAERLGQGGGNLVVADCRFQLDDPAAGRRAYGEGHIPGAVFFDLEADLSGPVTGRGGRHPLPDLDQLAEKLGKAGISRETMVVCYDDQKGSMAGRLWWLLRYMGAGRVAVLDGGYSAWLAAGYPTTTEVPRPEPRVFVPAIRHDMLVSVEEVRAMVREGRGVLVDSRVPERYRGEVEPLDPVAGHIPGAENYPWDGNVDEGGRFLGKEALRARFAPLQGTGPLVFYCGSGVSATANLLALERIGLRGAKLYAGGWSEWCSDPGNPVAITGEGGEEVVRGNPARGGS